MAKARKRAQSAAREVLAAAAKQLTGNGNELELDDEDDDAENEVIAELRGMGAGEGFKYRVNKVSGKQGEPQGYCATYDAGELSLDTIREQFGGGKYRIRVVDQAGQYKGNATVEIVGLPKVAAPAAPVAAPAQDLGGIAQIIASLKPVAPATDGGDRLMTMILAMMENQGKMIAAMSAASKGPSVAEILAIVNAKGGGGGDKSPTELLLEGLKLGRELAGDGGGSSELDVANKGLDVLASFAANHATQPAAPAAPVARPARLPAPAAAAVTALAQPGGQDVGIMQKINWLKAQTANLVRQAARDKDPELYAEVMLDNLPPFISAQEIRERLGAADAVQQLAALNSDVLRFSEWFEDFRTEVVRMLDEAAAEAAGQGGTPVPGAYPVESGADDPTP